MTKHIRQSGFTAVELLITLFVAAAFLIAGYQLFSVVVKDGGQARAESRAANVAYDYLRRYSSNATNPCTPQTPLTNSAVSIADLSNTKISISITCPSTSATSLSKVEATITFNSPQQTVKYSTFTTGSLTVGSNEITDGLIAWWKFNGNADTSVGSSNGTVSGATLSTGQNGQPNGAYSFNGVNNYIDAQISNLSGDAPHTISFWVNPTDLSGSKDFFTMGTPADNLYSSFENYNSTTYWYNYNNDMRVAQIPLNQWTLITGTYSGGGANTNNKKIYINGAQANIVSTGGASYGQSLSLPVTNPIGIGRDRGRNQSYFVGTIDDVRIYDRVLSPSEVSTLYGNGAK